MENKIKKWHIVIVAFSAILITIVFINRCRQGNCTGMDQKFIQYQLNGLITKKTILQDQHNAQVVYLDNRIKPIYVDALHATDFFKTIRIGDRLVKNSNSLECLIIRDDDTMAFSVNAPDCKQFIEVEQ